MPPLRRGDILLDRVLLSDWPLPADEGDKFDRGTVLVVAGSAETPGAALLAASAALRIGGGRLQVATAAETATAIAVAMPEAKVISIDESDNGPLAESLAAADAVVVGPGLQDIDQTCHVLTMALERSRDDAVIAVDAIGLVALPTVLTPSTRPHRLVITPNREELRSLTDEQGDTRQLARSVAQRFGLTVVSFGHVASPDGRMWIDTGTATGLGTSGAGDVLAGAVGGAGARCHRRAPSRLLGDAVPPPGGRPTVRNVRTDRLPRPAAGRRATPRFGRTLRDPMRPRAGTRHTGAGSPPGSPATDFGALQSKHAGCAADVVWTSAARLARRATCEHRTTRQNEPSVRRRPPISACSWRRRFESCSARVVRIHQTSR